jgi:alpha-ketoglutarate-dependent taurine dioxygenase
MIEVRRIAGALGAEITGVDLASDLDEDRIAAMRRAWLDHLVIFFRGQELPPAHFLAFARRFGEIIEYPFLRASTAFRKSPRSSSSSTSGLISAAFGIPIRLTWSARRWARC